jgi:hypothetical protein
MPGTKSGIRVKTRKQNYDVHPSVLMMRNWVESLPEKTGRSLKQWITLVRKEGPKEEKERIAWLKQVHGMGSNSAWWIAERAGARDLRSFDDDPERYLQLAPGYVDAMYAGPMADLRPIHDALCALARKLGKDIKICPCKTIVPIYRKNVIAQIKPTTRTRIDFGYALGDLKGKGRLKETGGYAKKDRITHCIAIASLNDIDAEVEKWLKLAYARNA